MNIEKEEREAIRWADGLDAKGQPNDLDSPDWVTLNGLNGLPKRGVKPGDPKPVGHVTDAERARYRAIYGRDFEAP